MKSCFDAIVPSPIDYPPAAAHAVLMLCSLPSEALLGSPLIPPLLLLFVLTPLELEQLAAILKAKAALL